MPLDRDELRASAWRIAHAVICFLLLGGFVLAVYWPDGEASPEGLHDYLDAEELYVGLWRHAVDDMDLELQRTDHQAILRRWTGDQAYIESHGKWTLYPLEGEISVSVDGPAGKIDHRYGAFEVSGSYSLTPLPESSAKFTNLFFKAIEPEEEYYE